MQRRHIIQILLASGMLAASINAHSAQMTLGALFKFTGTGASAGISGSIFDKDIHSGNTRSANGTLSDSYVLQGGDPFGGDTGDSFEVSQAFGHATVAGFDILTQYEFGNPACADQVGTCITAGPDTGWLFFQNTTLNEFTGILDLSGQAFGGIFGPAQFFENSGAVDLLPGQGKFILLNFESSNFGGYNHPEVCGANCSVPEPAPLALLGIGLLGLGFFSTRKKI